MTKSMLAKMLTAASLITVLTLPAPAAEPVEITLLYAQQRVIGEATEAIRTEFAKVHPEIKVTYLSSYKDMQASLEAVLRGAVTGQIPDITLQGFNRVRAISDRGLAVDLAPFIKAEPDWGKLGYDDALMSLGQVQGRQFAMGWAVSTPIVYYNEQLVKAAGGNTDNLNPTWDELYALASRIENPATKVSGFKIDWDTAGDWFWQGLVGSYGGTMLTPDEKTVAFNGEAGKKAIHTLARAVTDGKMHNSSVDTAQQDFFLGRLGIWIHSASLYGAAVKAAGSKFTVRTAAFPMGAGEKSRIPPGGVALVMTSKDPVKQKAAWEFMKFMTGPVAQGILIKTTGYSAANDLLAKDEKLTAEFMSYNGSYKTSASQLPYLTAWYGFPGPNGLKITDTIRDDLQGVVDQSTDPDTALRNMTLHVQALLPK